MIINTDDSNNISLIKRPPRDNPIKHIIGSLPDEQRVEVASLLDSLSTSERSLLRSELDEFKTIADGLSPSDRARRVFHIFKNLFGDKFDDEKNNGQIVDRYI